VAAPMPRTLARSSTVRYRPRAERSSTIASAFTIPMPGSDANCRTVALLIRTLESADRCLSARICPEKSAYGATASSTAWPIPDTRSSPPSDPKGPLAARSATIRPAKPGPIRGSLLSSKAGAWSMSILSPRVSGFAKRAAEAARESSCTVSEPVARYKTSPGATPPPIAIRTHKPTAARPRRISAAFLSSLETMVGRWVGLRRSLNPKYALRCWKMRYCDW